MVDFFCDPAGLRGEVNTALVNKRRGLNAYFPMPFRKAAKVELVYDGPVAAGRQPLEADALLQLRHVPHGRKIPDKRGYFHAYWRQQTLLLGRDDYLALDAKGKGKFVGWNVTIRRLGSGDYLTSDIPLLGRLRSM